jgi:hypothetical protein
MKNKKYPTVATKTEYFNVLDVVKLIKCDKVTTNTMDFISTTEYSCLFRIITINSDHYRLLRMLMLFMVDANGQNYVVWDLW